MKILPDVNVLISSTIAPLGIPRAIISAWRQAHLDLATANGIIAEVEEKLRSPRIRTKYRLSDEQIQTAIDVLRTLAEVVPVPAHSIDPVTGDPEDDYVLAAAALSHADYLVTGDMGLQALENYQGVKILSPRAFLDLLAARQGQNE
jgi:putative PIN family toxin of toxin-antitoxin system